MRHLQPRHQIEVGAPTLALVSTERVGENQGNAQFFPVHLPVGMTISSLVTMYLPWGTPALMGAPGVRSDTDEPAMFVSYEWPIPYLYTVDALEKHDLERLHADRFRSDCLLGKGTTPWRHLERGDDPPDFLVDLDGSKVSLECTQLTDPKRRLAHGLFDTVRARVMEEPARFEKLAGYVITMWFTSDDYPGIVLPHRRTDVPAEADLVDLLAGYRPNPNQLRVPGGALPETAPPLGDVSTIHGARFYAAPLNGAAPATPFFARMGFELGLSYTTSHTRASAWEALRSRVHAKDREENEWLLVTAGGPNRYGLVHPSEDWLGRFALQHGGTITDLAHLERVIVHIWGTGQAAEVYPEFNPLVGELYAGIAPAYHGNAVSIERESR